MRDWPDNFLASVGNPELRLCGEAGRRTATDGVDLQQLFRMVVPAWRPGATSDLVWSDAMDLDAKLFGLWATAHHRARWDVIYEAIAYTAKVRGYAKVHGYTTQAPFTGGRSGGTSTGGGEENAPAKKMMKLAHGKLSFS